MKNLLEPILLRYGQDLTVNGGSTVRAFLQPVTDRAKASPYTVTPLGTVDDRLWIYLGSAALSPGDTVAWYDRSFTVRNSEPVGSGTELQHWWAALAPAREAKE